MQMVSRQIAKQTMENTLDASSWNMRDWETDKRLECIVVCSWSPGTHISSGHNEDNWIYNSTILDFETQISST